MDDKSLGASICILVVVVCLCVGVVVFYLSWSCHEPIAVMGTLDSIFVPDHRFQQFGYPIVLTIDGVEFTGVLKTGLTSVVEVRSDGVLVERCKSFDDLVALHGKRVVVMYETPCLPSEWSQVESGFVDFWLLEG